MEKLNLISLFALGMPLTAISQSSVMERASPNFVLIIADDVSFDDLGCYGNMQVKTPNIDRLASSGIRFTNMFLTASSSSPSRNSIITGRYPHNTGGAELHSEPPDYMVSFPEILKRSGYYTAQAGKFHMGPYARRGFDSVNDNAKLNGDGGEELWIKCLRDRPRDKPFLMWFAAMDAHRIWGPNDFSGTHDPSGLTPPFYLAQGEKTKSDLAAYYDEIARLDNYIGLVSEELKLQGIAENTVIIIMADNGRPFPHSKTRVNDRGLKTPFILYWPAGIGTKPVVCNSLLSSVDIAPTILQLASQEIPETIQGISFASLLRNPAKELRTYVFAEHNWHDYEAHERMVRTRDHLFILNSRPAFPQLGPADAIGSLSFNELDSLRKIVIIKSGDSVKVIQKDTIMVFSDDFDTTITVDGGIGYYQFDMPEFPDIPELSDMPELSYFYFNEDQLDEAGEFERAYREQFRAQELERMQRELEKGQREMEREWKWTQAPPEPRIKQSERIIRQELRDYGLTEKGRNYIIELDGKAMYINGDKQPKETYRKYRKLVESLEQVDFDSGETFKMIF